MIGTHDSFTFLKSNWFNECFSFLWRTQNLNIEEQRKKGVKYFDVRVRRTRSLKYDFPGWVLCHGYVDFDWYFLTLETLLAHLPEGTHARIILERGNAEDEALFKLEVRELTEKENPKFDAAIIKKGWRVLKPSYFKFKDYTYIPWHSGESLIYNIKNFKFSTIKKWAKKHNPVFNIGHKGSKVVHFVDFI